MKRSRSPVRVGVVFGLLAAVSFGVSAPLAQRLVAHTDPQLLAGLLYGGAAAVLVAAGSSRRRNESPVRVADVPVLIAVVVAGGIVAPVLLLVGLERVSAVTGSLVLNLEAPLTAVLAVFVFREHLGSRSWAAGVVIVAGAALLGVGPGAGTGSLIGVTLIAAACTCWALDNNLTQRLTVRDPVVIVRVKAFGALVVNLSIAAVRGAAWPAAWVVVAAIGLGALSYGASILFDAYALRLLGAAREAAVFATAPFAGTLLAVVALNDPLGVASGVALGVMAAGTVLLLSDRHAHLHEHVVTVHEHRHIHDAHHQHEHPQGMTNDEPHSHVHRHDPLFHTHTHVSDVHHRHAHRRRVSPEPHA